MQCSNCKYKKNAYLQKECFGGQMTILLYTFLIIPVTSTGNFFYSSGPSTGLGSPLGRSRHHSSQSDLTGPPTTSSGLSFTACMSDFSLYVFHPYGAGKQKSAVTGLPPGPGPLGKSFTQRRKLQTFPHSKDHLFNIESMIN